MKETLGLGALVAAGLTGCITSFGGYGGGVIGCLTLLWIMGPGVEMRAGPTKAFRHSISVLTLLQQEQFSRMADLALSAPLSERDYIAAQHGTASYTLRLCHPAPVGEHRCTGQQVKLGMDLTVRTLGQCARHLPPKVRYALLPEGDICLSEAMSELAAATHQDKPRKGSWGSL